MRSPAFSASVLWHDGATPPEVPAAPLPDRADLVVVGAGYGGLAAARRLATAGRHVVVVEADRLGAGASTRNGGMVIPELKAGPQALRRRYGELSTRMNAEVNAAFDLVERLAGPGGIDCDYERTGQLWLAHAEGRVREVRALVEDHAAEGEDVRFLDRDALGAEIGSDAFPAAALIARTGGLDPARYHAGLARLALGAGAELHDRTRAVSLTPRPAAAGGGTVVLTERGPIVADAVIVTTNATADALVPRLRRGVLPMGSFIIATEVLDPALLDAVTPTRRMMVDTKNLLFYWRATPDGRLAFGGRRSLSPSTLAESTDFLYDAMTRLHPQLAGVPVERAWGGSVALTLDRMPHAGRHDNVWWCTGCNGSGVALMTGMGDRTAGALLGDESPSAFAELALRPIPLTRFRRWWLPVVGQWFRAQDRRR